MGMGAIAANRRRAAGAGLTAPVLTKTSSPGGSPFAFDEAIPAGIFAGYLREVQTDDDVAFGSPAQYLYKPVTDPEIAGDQADWSTGSLMPPRRVSDDVIEALVLNWSGQRYLRMRYARDNGDGTFTTSAWSNVIGDDIEVTAFVTTDPSVFKNATLTVSGAGTRAVPAGTGHWQFVALDRNATGNSFDITILLNTANGFLAGFYDPTGHDLSVNDYIPGSGNSDGLFYQRFNSGAFIDGAGGSQSGVYVPVDGDTIIYRVDRVAKTFKVFKGDGTTQIGTTCTVANAAVLSRFFAGGGNVGAADISLVSTGAY